MWARIFQALIRIRSFLASEFHDVFEGSTIVSRPAVPFRTGNFLLPCLELLSHLLLHWVSARSH